MLKLKLDAEKLKDVKAGITFCCWGGSGDGCDCSKYATDPGNVKFGIRSNIWTTRMDILDKTKSKKS